jgi:hypothetical protein
MIAPRSPSCSCPDPASRGPARATRARRLLGVVEWVVPGTVLALMPKCPACVAIYVAAGTGLGLSVSAAWYVRTAAIAGSVATLLFLAVRTSRGLRHAPAASSKALAAART